MTSIRDWALFCIAVLFLMIGVHQTMLYGFGPSYWAFMISAGCLMYYGYRKSQASQYSQQDENTKPKSPSKKKK
ncbi:MAG: hypothetical protein MUF42_05605 [Cytophagaceae bacterium]|jgi:fucose 4-O-acetylase-like acetyltransferase|nr:hypothetical protein [Cytophagaceae bacterium]